MAAISDRLPSTENFSLFLVDDLPYTVTFCTYVPQKIAAKLTQDDVIFLWVKRNRGVCSKIAASLNVSKEFVSKVLYRPEKRSKESRVEWALIEAGAPFIRERLEGTE